MRGEHSQRIAARPMLEALEPRVLLDGAAPEEAAELFSVSPALFVENQGQWADEVPLAGTGGAASEASPQWPATAPGDDIPVEVLSQWGGAVANAVVVGDYAYACRGLALDILDIRDPSQPVAAVASLVSILGSAAPLFADSVYWTGSGDTPNWSDVANWNTGAMPQPADSVIFDATRVKYSYIDAGFGGTVASITINGYAGLIRQERALAITGDYSQSSGQFSSPPNFPFSVGNSFSVSAPGAVMFGRSTGIGTVNDPILIYDVYGLQCLRDGAALYYKLNNDIDASVTINWRRGIPGREGFSPIGGTTDSMFYHSVDGDGHTISNLFINITDLSQNNVGLFGYNMNTIKNLGMVNCSITGPSYIAGTDNYTGSIAGYNYGTISNCYNTGSVSSQCYSGGLAGRNAGTISNCYNSGNISGSPAGGLIGHNYSSGKISDCYNSGNIFGIWYAGGLVGGFNYGTISNSYNSGSVSAGVFNPYNSGGSAGGLVGWRNQGTISNCYNTGTITQLESDGNNGNVGGLVAYNILPGTIKNSYNAGKVFGDHAVGGLIGYDYRGKIYNSYNIGIVSPLRWPNSAVSGFIGGFYDYSRTTISNCGVWMGATQPPHFYDLTYNEADRNAFTNPSHGVYTNTALNTFNPWNFSAIWDMYAGSSFPFFRWQDSSAPDVVSVNLNSRPGRTVSDIEPSGIGVRTIDIQFSEAVFFSSVAVGVKAVEFSTGQEQERPGALPAVAVTGSGTNVMTITLGDPAGTVGAVDMWVKVALASAGITDAAGNALDGEPENDSSGLGYIYDAGEDLPSGDGTAGGDAVFYVGSLRGDFNGDGFVTAADKAGFLAAWYAKSLDADFRGVGYGVRPPDGKITLGDIDGFTSVYLGAVAAGRHLDPLPVGGGPLAAGVPEPLPMMAQATSGSETAGVDVLGMTEPVAVGPVPAATPVANNRTVAANLAVALLREGGVTNPDKTWAVGVSGTQATPSEIASALDVRQPQEAETAFKKLGNRAPRAPDLLIGLVSRK